MNDYYFYNSMRRTIISFLQLFSDIKIGRYDAAGTLLKTVQVPVRYSPKSKAYLYVRDNSRNEEMLPMISVDLQSIDFDASRMTNRHENITVLQSTSESLTSFYKNVVPYNLTFNVRLWTLHMVDVDQFYEQVLPYFAPYVFIKVHIPEVDTIIEVKVVLSSCSPEMTDDVSEEESRVIRWATMFVCNAWMFKPITDVNIINKIIINQYPTEQGWADRSTTSAFLSAGQAGLGESMYLEGTGYDEDAKILANYELFTGGV